MIYIADRTGFWLKEQKQFEPWTFGCLCLASLAVGLATVKRADKDMGFLNRDQTDEWKGWMQSKHLRSLIIWNVIVVHARTQIVVILIYHYCGASGISGIYNPVRVLVAAYLFMTGYGHTSYHIRKADFSFHRVARVSVLFSSKIEINSQSFDVKVLIRINLFTVLLAYSMNTDYISYYFTPLVSMWYIVIYFTLAVGAQFNDRTIFVLCKILASAAFMTCFMKSSLLKLFFDTLFRFCGVRWSSYEWSFRVNLDLWIVYVGIMAAIAVIKVREYRLMDHLHWHLVVKTSIGISAAIILWFFAFELYQESKYTYNAWHPYISFLPILAFTILRNSNPILRSASSRTFAFMGKCSLETFVIQFHFWLAGDTKGVLLVIPGTRWRPLNFIVITVMFIYLSDRVAFSATQITISFCGGSSSPARALPLPVTAPAHIPEERDADIQAPMHNLKDDAVNRLLEPETPVRPRWVDRLADGTPPQKRWTPGIKTKSVVLLGALWLLNLLWSYPYDAIA